MDLPNGVQDYGSVSLVISLNCLEIVLEAIGSNASHADNESAAEFGEISCFFGVAGPARTGSDSKSYICGAILDHAVNPV